MFLFSDAELGLRATGTPVWISFQGLQIKSRFSLTNKFDEIFKDVLRLQNLNSEKRCNFSTYSATRPDNEERAENERWGWGLS